MQIIILSKNFFFQCVFFLHMFFFVYLFFYHLRRNILSSIFGNAKTLKKKPLRGFFCILAFRRSRFLKFRKKKKQGIKNFFTCKKIFLRVQLNVIKMKFCTMEFYCKIFYLIKTKCKKISHLNFFKKFTSNTFTIFESCRIG